MSDTFEPNELYKFENVILDIARQFGNESQKSQDRIARLVNRAMTLVIGANRQWRFLKKVETITTSASVSEYTLNTDVEEILLFWKTGSHRGPLTRIPEGQFRAFVPDESVYTGIPNLWDDEGVDSNGSMVVSFWPIPSGAVEIKYQYYRRLVPLRNPQQNLIAVWGVPPRVIEAIIQMATALTFKGIDDARYKAERAEAEEMAEAYFIADQFNGNTEIRVPAVHPGELIGGGPQLPSNYPNY